MNVRIGHRGDRWVELGAWHAVTGEAHRFCDATGALLFLRERMTPGDIRALRGLLTRVTATNRPLDDAALLRLVAHCLHSRTLKAVVWHERRYGVALKIETWQPARVELPAPAPRESAPVDELPIAPPPPAPVPVPELSDGEAQAIALRKAARDGVPFCEECQSTPSPPPVDKGPVDALPANNDPVAQAEALWAAASDGTPFCAICQRASAAS